MRSTPLRTKGLLEAASCAVVLALGISFAQTTSTQSQVVTLPVDRGPEGVAFDGVNIWIANSVGNTVTKLRASDGANLGTFPVGKRPVGIAFDGTSIWVANQFSDSVTQLRALDGANLGTIPVGRKPFAVAFAGGYIWVANYVSKDV